MRRIFISTLTLLVLFTAAAMAADNRPEITSSTLDKYLKVLPGIVALFQKADTSGSTGMEGLTGALQGSQLSSKLTSYLSKNGWKAEEFAGVHGIVTSATSYLVAKPELAKAQKQMAAKKKEMMADPNIPEAVKKQMLTMMEQQGGGNTGSGGNTGFMGQMEDVVKDLSPSELKLLEANKDRIIKVYKGLRK
jgi:hypothetical protein